MNIIIGATDSGKSAIIRALNWVITNKPGGDSFRSYWGGDTIVEILLSSGDTIIRKKGNSVNEYSLNDLKFNAFGQDVPEEIKKVLNINSVNIQQQLDSPFLLSETSGNIALHFNKVAKLDLIDIMTSNVQKEIRQLTSDINYTKEIIVEKEKQLTEFDLIQKFEKELSNLEKRKELLDDKRQEARELRIIIDILEETRDNLKQEELKIVSEDIINQLTNLYFKKSEITSKYTELKKLSLKIYNTQQEIEKGTENVKNETLVNELLKNIEISSKQSQTIKNLLKLMQNITHVTNSLKIEENRLSEKQQKFNNNMPEVCPLCGNIKKK